MRSGSLLLILVAVTLFVTGLAGGSHTLLVGAIGASLLATVMMLARARQAAPVRVGGRHDGDD